MKSLKIIILLQGLLFSVSGVAVEEGFSPRLTPQQQLRVANLKRHDFPVDTIEVEVSGRKRLVVLVGETHLLSEERFRAGENIFSDFDLVSIEGVRSTASFCYKPSLLTHLLLPSFFCNTKISGKKVGKFPGLVHNVQDAFFKSLSEAKIDPETLQYYYLSLKAIEKTLDLSKGCTDTTREQFIAEAKEIRTILYQDRFEVVQLEYNNEESKTAASSYLSSTKKFMLSGSLLNGIFTTSLIGLGLAGCYTPSLFQSLYTATASVLGIGGYLFCREKIRSCYVGSRVSSLNIRNRVMCSNIHKAFYLRPEKQTMLVLVGESHMEGMRKILRPL